MRKKNRPPFYRIEIQERWKSLGPEVTHYEEKEKFIKVAFKEKESIIHTVEHSSNYTNLTRAYKRLSNIVAQYKDIVDNHEKLKLPSYMTIKRNINLRNSYLYVLEINKNKSLYVFIRREWFEERVLELKEF